MQPLFTSPVNFEIPEHACDCHTHIYADPRRFPMSPERVYTPEVVEPREMSELHRKLGIERVVIVHPNTHGTDNSVTLYGMKARGDNARGVALIDDRTSDRDIEALTQAGMRGARINLRLRYAEEHDAARGREQFQALAARVKKHNWHIQIFTTLPVIAGLRDLVEDCPVPVVFDHFGGLQAALGLEQPGFEDLVDLVGSGKAWIKLSAAYRCSTQAPDYADITPFAKALIASNADCILWGTDWPHPTGVTPPGRAATEVTPMHRIDDGRLLNQFPIWEPNAEIRKKILVDNPARLYGF
ncbi:MAG: amidohydrolase family protein [Bryobacteraceae bacterium]